MAIASAATAAVPNCCLTVATTVDGRVAKLYGSPRGQTSQPLTKLITTRPSKNSQGPR